MVGPTKPALAVHLVAAAVEEVSGGQAVHVMDPTAAEYVPAGHVVHAVAEVMAEVE